MAVWHDIAARALQIVGRSGGGASGAAVTADTEAGPVRLQVWRGAGAGDDSPVYIHFPDTAFIGPTPRADRELAAALADALQIVVLLVETPRAPARRFPVQPTEAQALVWWAMLAGRKQGWNGKQLGIGGHGTGANLALGTCLELPARMGVKPAGLLALAPVLDLTHTTGWRERIAQGAYLPDRAAQLAPLASPLRAPAKSLAGFAPSLVVVEEGHPRRAEGEAFASMLQAAGRDVHLVPAPRARDARDAIEGFLMRIFARPTART